MLKFLFGSVNERKIKRFHPYVEKINQLEAEYQKLSDDNLKAKTSEFKQRLANGEALDNLLIESFATVREVAQRSIGLRPYDVQLIGGIALHKGMIAEMRTGEGKTLVATLPAYLNALTEKGVHIVTVNDYLAKRDAEWMGQVYNFLGMDVGCVIPGLDDTERQENYHTHITYCTNNELGFDYLRDNMKYALGHKAQRGHVYAIVDEVDSILIDESRTPLIISGPTDDRSEFYKSIDTLIPALQDSDYETDEKNKSTNLTEQGNEKLEQKLIKMDMLVNQNLYDIENVSLVHHINQALKAHKLFQKDKDYILKNGEVLLIDEFTGRIMEGRRLSEGLHQAIEAKENVEIKPENVTLASITFQNYFRLYDKLSGMTGTAVTEAVEFQDTYHLDVLEIPTHKPIKRIDEDDALFLRANDKYSAILKEIKEAHQKKQPLLVGTASIDKSEYLSELLKKEKLPHHVLNARHHEKEAYIISQAGIPGAITIATNMAGRGTDIQLGGNPEIMLKDALKGEETEDEIQSKRQAIQKTIEKRKQEALKAGGLYVLGTERHESRRIDNQLRGRTGRQGDPGKSKFFVSAEDDLMRIFGTSMDTLMRKFGMTDSEAISHPFMNKALETAQKRVEQHNYEARKNLLKYDDVINNQRKAIFEQRLEYMTEEDVDDIIKDMRHDYLPELVESYIPPKSYLEQWDVKSLKEKLDQEFDLDLPIMDWAKEEGIAEEEISNRILDKADQKYALLVTQIGTEQLRNIEKQILLQSIDHHWREHLFQLDHLRSVIGLRGYAQKDPLNEFKSETFILFENMLSELRATITKFTLSLNANHIDEKIEQESKQIETIETHIDPDTQQNKMELSSESRQKQQPVRSNHIPRNAPCPCGSGKKYKHCHGHVKHLSQSKS